MFPAVLSHRNLLFDIIKDESFKAVFALNCKYGEGIGGGFKDSFREA